MIVTICGGKGGVGKSTVALNLAAELDAVLVDADIAMADLPTDRGPTLHDVLAGRVDVLEAVRDDWAVGVLPAGRSLAGARSVDLGEFESVLSTLAGTYRWVIIDSPAGFEADAAIAMVAADVCVLVTTPDPATIADGLRTRSLAGELDTGIGAVVLNHATETHDVLRDVLGGPQVAIPESTALHEAQREGVPLTLGGTDPSVTEAFETLGRHLTRIERDVRLGGSPE